MAQAFDAEFIALSAVFSGVKDIREAVQPRAARRCSRSGRHTILFVDEVHRFNKAQQDAFLPFVEQGLHHLHRRDDRESVVRSEQRAALARGGLRAAAAVRRGARRSCSSARGSEALDGACVRTGAEL